MTTAREIPFARPWIDDQDRAAVMRVLNGHILTHGPECKAFEAEFSQLVGPTPTPYSVSVSSCMAALHLAWLHLKLGPGDEVIVPSQTHVATIHAVEWVGARPVFIDCDPATGNITADRVEAAITPKTRALSLVHFVGLPCDMTAIMAVANKHKLHVVEDCAISVGARWNGVHVGLFGDVGCFSFYPVKHITTAEGGMFLTRHQAVAESVARLRAFGVDRTHTERAIPGMYEVPSLGLNYRMSEMQAALGRTQLAKWGQIFERRRANFTALKTVLGGVGEIRILDSAAPQATTSAYCLVAVLSDKLGQRRNDLISKLNARGVGTSVYYPQPTNRMKYYREKYGWQPERFKEATRISDQGIALPVGPHLNPDDMRYIAQTFKAVIAEEK